MSLDAKNHIVTLFLISNAFNGFGFGLFLFAFGVGSGVVVGMAEGFACCIGLGIAIICMAVVGCTGAITQHKKKLEAYASSLVILTAAEIAHLVMLSLSRAPSRRADDFSLWAYFVTMIFIIVISIVSVLLAWTMSYRIGHVREIPAFAEKA